MLWGRANQSEMLAVPHRCLYIEDGIERLLEYTKISN